MTKYLALVPLAGLALAFGCGGANDGGKDGDPTVCIGAKCDTPEATEAGERQKQCLNRQDEVLESSKRAFTEEWVRWSCGDVEGVNAAGTDDRGQEYCEYFAIVDLPGHSPIDLGRRRTGERGDVTPWSICVEGESSFSAEAEAACATKITEDEIFDLEDNPDSVVGQCIFTSWMSDVPGPLPCDKGDCASDVMGYPLNEEFFRMKLDTNSNATASSLVQTCAEIRAKESILAPLPDFNNPDDEFHSPFYRGCWMAGSFGLAWRRSDPAICAVANRVVECGCTLPGVDPKDVGAAVLPPQPDANGEVNVRGFQLGDWNSPTTLPAGCNYIKTGDGSRTLVGCDLTATDVTANLSDPKEACRQIYGDGIVAHAPVPADVLECNPQPGPLTAECGAMPWNIGREGGVAAP
ncbi:MAG: hypothetical protein AAF721_04835 [Myxococcota bacterium]